MRREVAPVLFVLEDTIEFEIPVVFHEKYPFPVFVQDSGYISDF